MLSYHALEHIKIHHSDPEKSGMYVQCSSFLPILLVLRISHNSSLEKFFDVDSLRCA